MNVIALVGFAGSGKDTAASHLVDNYNFIPFSFAESLKDTLATVFCWDRELLSGSTHESRKWRETPDEWWGKKLGISDFTPRKALQLIGTDLFRKHFDPDIWILNIERKITLLPENSLVILTDGRFPNELSLIRRFGGKIIRIKRGEEPIWFETALVANGFGNPDDAKWAERQMNDVFSVHKSEWAWIGQSLDHVIINNADINALQKETERYWSNIIK